MNNQAYLLSGIGVVAAVGWASALALWKKTQQPRNNTTIIDKPKPKTIPLSERLLKTMSKNERIHDTSGWQIYHVDPSYLPEAFAHTAVPFINDTQRGVFAKDKNYGVFVSVRLIDNYNDEEVLHAISSVPEITERLNQELTEKTSIVSAIGVASHIWRRYDQSPPSKLKTFQQKVAKDGRVVFPATGGDLFLFARANNIDDLYELTKQVKFSFGKNLKSFERYTSFTHDPTKKFNPNSPKDLTGFVDGTRNPDHLLRALVDETIIFPSDEEKRHVGGSYMYVGRFVHHLEKFWPMSSEEKSDIIGRNYDVIKAHKGYDSRPENPRLDQSDYLDRKSVKAGEALSEVKPWHTHRGHGSMYRQAMPYFQGEEEGLYFIAFSRTLDEFEATLNRMSGNFENSDGSLDNLFKISEAVTSNYYYVPSLPELLELKNWKQIPANLRVPESGAIVTNATSSKSTDDEPVIYAEYCTNCGYKTIFNKKKKVITSLLPTVKIIENHISPRLSAFELVLPDKRVIWSKLAQPDGMNNYPECFPTDQQIVLKLKEYFPHLKNIESPYDKPGLTKWGESDWNEEDLVCSTPPTNNTNNSPSSN
eukprot:TRINITY_DN5134_c0_g1_i1.p1 TRINITY_DN5134_c0_g1~~TRINITY_DN5134_c0_g1_i1.p1  ORF type:complete len:592 (-),score=164.93 TRINITY_DN5134_c0_g1_i1:107-1882(-)